MRPLSGLWAGSCMQWTDECWKIHGISISLLMWCLLSAQHSECPLIPSRSEAVLSRTVRCGGQPGLPGPASLSLLAAGWQMKTHRSSFWPGKSMDRDRRCLRASLSYARVLSSPTKDLNRVCDMKTGWRPLLCEVGQVGL